MLTVEPYRVQFMGDDCYLVCLSTHTGEHFKQQVGEELAENNHSLNFEIMVKRQDSVEAIVREAKRKLRELLPLIAEGVQG